MASNTIVDLKWMSRGGLLLDSDGDISFTDTSLESVQDMVVTRVQAALNGWKQYRIGADLEALIGTTVDDELEITIQKQVTQCLTNELFAKGSFTVETIQVANTINVFVYKQGVLLATTTVSTN